MLMLALVLGCLFGLGLGIGWLPVAISLLLLAVYVHAVVESLSWSWFRMVVFNGLLGFVYFLANLYWLVSIKPQNWTSLTAAQGNGFVAFALVGSVATLSLGFIAAAAIARFVKTTTSHSYAVLCLPVIVAISELIRAYAYSLFVSGPESLIGAHWTYGIFALASTNSWLVLVSRYVGILGLSAVMVALAIALRGLLLRYGQIPTPRLLVLLALFAIFVSLPRPHYEPSAQAVKREIAVLHIKAYGVPSPDEVFISQHKVDALIMPEYGNVFGTNNVLLASYINDDGLAIFSGSETHQQQTPRTEIVFQRSDGTVAQKYYKQFLIPAGEYLPYVIRTILASAGTAQPDELIADRRVKASTMPEGVYTHDGVTYGALSCSGIVAPHLYQNLAHQGADVLINNASLNIFNDSSLFAHQAKIMGVLNAVANNAYFIQSARGSSSFVIDPNGDISNQTEGENSAIYTTLTVDADNRTAYSQFGERPLLVATALLVLLGLSRKLITSEGLLGRLAGSRR